MTARTKVADEIAAIEDLMSDLEKRLRRLSTGAKREVSGASSEIDDFVNDALSGIMKRVRNGTSSVVESVADEATKLGGDAFKRIADEVENRPLTMLAVAAGVGFLFGMSRR
jgi:ElaB/YqjD/DUF883 family membrane-anchored ribosome-binding protein